MAPSKVATASIITTTSASTAFTAVTSTSHIVLGPKPDSTISSAADTVSMRTTNSFVRSSHGAARAAGAAEATEPPQLFWITIGNYQIIEAFLLLKADFHEALIELLSSINFSTFNLAIIKLPFIESLKDVMVKPSSPNEVNFEQERMKRAGFSNLFVADYLYFFMYLTLLLIFHILVRTFVKMPDSEESKPKSKWDKLKEIILSYVSFQMYFKLVLLTYFFMTISAFIEFKFSPESSLEIFSVCFAAGCFLGMQCFTIYAILHYCLYARKTEEKLNSIFYTGLKTGKWARLYTVFFLFRRLLLAVILVFSRDPAVQISLLFALQLSALLYL